MKDQTWQPEFMAKRLPSGLSSPVVSLHRSAGEGALESSLTYEGQYPTWAQAADAARRLYGQATTPPMPDGDAA